ncbi:hypothetical protein B0H11DRAFT_1695659, partial [Mycena galericulata]
CPICGRLFASSDKLIFRAHVVAHRANGQAWRCGGVPKEDAANYGVSCDALDYTFMGRAMVGGCMRTFTQRWKLEAHLRRRFNTCQSDL